MGAYRFAIRMLNLKLHKPHNVLITVSLLFGLVFYSTILLLSISVLYNEEVMMGLNYSPVFPLDENQFGDLSSSTLNRALERVKKKISAAMFPGVDNFSSYTINQFDLKPLNNVAPIMKKGNTHFPLSFALVTEFLVLHFMKDWGQFTMTSLSLSIQ